MKLLFSLLITILLFSFIYSERNAEEEAICAPFLTSRNTSPLMKTIPRNITYDEIAEFSCEIVLQDDTLPLQIRVTIHEGLYNLALRHIEQGYTASSARAEKSSLLPRESVAYYHAKSLASILKKSCIFQFNAGLWAMHPMISRPDEAISYFENCLPSGSASNDKDFFSIPMNIYDLYNYLIKAYNNLHDNENALKYTKELLKEFPFDLEMKFLQDLLISKLSKDHHSNKGDAHSNIFGSNSAYNNFISLIENIITKEKKENPDFYNRYHPSLFSNNPEMIATTTSTTTIHGESLPSLPHHPDHPHPVRPHLPSWKPIHYHEMITPELFQKHIHDRQPFIISLNDSSLFDSITGWTTNKWFLNDKEYLKEKLYDYKLMTESLPYSNYEKDNLNLFGLGINVQREYQLFSDLLNENFQINDKLYYLNIQPDDSGDRFYRPPLHLFEQDLPVPDVHHHHQHHQHDDDHSKSASSSSSSSPFLEIIANNLTAINLWMGKIPKNLSFTQSRLHRDATDNLYFLYEGKKKFYLWNPNYGEELKTINPIIGTNPLGLTYHWNINSFRTFFQEYLKENQLTLLQFFLHSSNNNNTNKSNTNNHQEDISNIQSNEYFMALENLLSQSIDYDHENIHFSKFHSKFSPFEINSLTLFGNDPITTEKRKYLQEHSSIPLPEYIIDLQPGDIFYLPTGYYHEVFSYEGQHTAMNLWWKPLDWKAALPIEKEMNEKLFHRIIQELQQSQQ